MICRSEAPYTQTELKVLVDQKEEEERRRLEQEEEEERLRIQEQTEEIGHGE